MKKSSRFAAQIAMWIIAMVGANLAIARLTVNSVPRAVARSIDASPPITDLFLGNSLVQAGVNARTFGTHAVGRALLNAGLGASYPPEHNVLLRRALKQKPERVFYGFFDDQLFRPSQGGWEDLTGNRALAYYLDPETSIRFYAKDSPWDAWRMRLIARIPALVERQTLWARVERVRRRLSEIGFPRVEINRFGRADDFRSLESQTPATFRRFCFEAATARLPFDDPVADLITQVVNSGARMVLVEMPMPRAHRERFYATPEWVQLRHHMQLEAKRLNATYLDASDWVADDGFADPLHLNAQGAEVFSRRLAQLDIPRTSRNAPGLPPELQTH